jgi:hypothetical protein
LTILSIYISYTIGIDVCPENRRAVKKTMVFRFVHYIFPAILIVCLHAPAYAGWTPPVRISDEATAYNPRIVANGDTLHVAYWKGGLYTATYYLRSENQGVDWNVPFLLADTVNTSNSVSPVIRGSGDSITVIWKYTAGPSRWNFGLRQSNDGGETWSEVVAILPTDNFELQKHSFCIWNGMTFFIYSRWSQGITVEFMKSTDWGETWTEPTEVFRTQETGRIDMVARGDTIHFVWSGRFNYDDEWEIYYIRSTDSGESWSENTMLSTYDEYGTNFPTISVNSLGNIAVGWMDYKHSPYLITGDIFIRYSYDGGESWIEEEQLTAHHLVFPVRVLWSGDSIHAVWEDWRNEQPDIYYNCSTDNGLTWGEEQRVEDDPGSSEDPDLAVIGENIHLVWADFGQTSGSGIYYSRWEEGVGIDYDEYKPLPGTIRLAAHPNPFNESTVITYSLSEGGEIGIYNIRGQEIRTLTTDSKEGKIIWDARDALGNKVSSGIYFARARGAAGYSTIKLIYLR